MESFGGVDSRFVKYEAVRMEQLRTFMEVDAMRDTQEGQEVYSDSCYSEYGHGFVLTMWEQRPLDRAASPAEVEEALAQMQTQIQAQEEISVGLGGGEKLVEWLPILDCPVPGGWWRGDH